MNEISTQVKKESVIIFFDGTKKWINNKQAEFIIEQSGSNKKGVLIDGSFYAFSSISKILSAKDYYEQFPEEIPTKYNQFDELLNETQEPVINAKELIKQGFIQYYTEIGKTTKEAEQEWIKVTHKEIILKIYERQTISKKS